MYYTNCKKSNLKTRAISSLTILLLIFTINVSFAFERKMVFYQIPLLERNHSIDLLMTNFNFSINYSAYADTGLTQKRKSSNPKIISPNSQLNDTSIRVKSKRLNAKSSKDTLLADKNWNAQWERIPPLQRIKMERKFGRLILINGKIASDKQINTLTATEINHLEIKDDQQTRTLYGERGRNGVLLVVTNEMHN